MDAKAFIISSRKRGLKTTDQITEGGSVSF